MRMKERGILSYKKCVHDVIVMPYAANYVDHNMYFTMETLSESIFSVCGCSRLHRCDYRLDMRGV